MLARLLRDGPARRSRSTAASSRSSSATRSSASSACRPRTRTTPSARSAPAFGSSRTPRRSRRSAAQPLRLRVGHQHRGGARAPRDHRRASARGSSPGTRSTPPRGSSRSRPRWAWRSGSATYEATALVFDYEELEPATLKGKAEPVRVFHRDGPAGPARHRPHPHARHAVHRARDRPRAPEGRLRQDASPRAPSQLVTVVGRARARQEPDRRRARRATSTRTPSSSPGARDGASPTARASRSGRSARS